MIRTLQNERTFARLGFFASAALHHYTPYRIAGRKLQRTLPKYLSQVAPDLLQRVHYYNRLSTPAHTPPSQALINLSKNKDSFYYFDLMRDAKGFGPNFLVDPLFGDITHVPDKATVVKSRPIFGNNANSVLLKLDRMRHFHFPRDPLHWDQKRPSVVWRGRINNQPPRQAAVELFYNHSEFDIGHIQSWKDLPPVKPWLSLNEQFAHRYILSLEGNDVATNLKWIMGSNSVALSPAMQFETWFMEGRLVPGKHFVEVRADLADLEEKVSWLEANPDHAKQIVQNANSWVKQFLDPVKEHLIAVLVLQKYAEMTGGLASSTINHRLFT